MSAWLYGHNACVPRQIHPCTEDRAWGGRCQEGGHRFGLTSTNLDHHPPAIGKPAQHTRQDPVELQPVRAAIERGQRIEKADLRFQLPYIGGGNVGRIRNHEIVATRRPPNLLAAPFRTS